MVLHQLVTPKKGGSLIEDPEQADKIRMIFDKYLKLQSVSKLHNYLRENKIHTITDKIFYKGHLHKLLRNKVYIGKIEHKDEVYEGLHDGIIDESVFEKVQKILDFNVVRKKNSVGAKHSCLLAGKIFDDRGNIMSPSHSNNKYKKTYRYYISQAIIQNRQHEAGTISKIPAKEIEKFVTYKIEELVKNKELVQEYLSEFPLKKQVAILKYLETYVLDAIFIRAIISKIVICEDKITIQIDKDILVKSLEAVTYDLLLNFKSDLNNLIEMVYKVSLSATPQKGMKIVLAHDRAEINLTLVRAITKGFYYHKLREEGKLTEEQKTSLTYRLMNLRFLPPKLIEDILAGKQDRTLTVKQLYKMVKV